METQTGHTAGMWQGFGSNPGKYAVSGGRGVVNWGWPRIPGWLVPRFLLYFPKQTQQGRWVTEFNLFPSGFSF